MRDRIIDPTSWVKDWPPPRHSVIGFSGTRNDPDPAVLLPVLGGLWGMKGFISGACTGVDHHAASWCSIVYQYPHVVVVPADHSLIHRWWEEPPGFEAERAPVFVEQMPDGTTYKDRNAQIAKRCTALVAFPEYPEKHPRSRHSGTWQTIRMVRTLGKPTYVFPLEES